MIAKLKVLVITLVISFILVVLGTFGGPGVLGNTIILSAIIVAVPQVILSYAEYKELKEIEEKFPIFVRNLMEAVNSGMSLPQAIMFVSKYDYGKLTPYVKKMANQLSWGIPLVKVLDQFIEKIRRSKELVRSVRILQETFKSGGDIGKTLETIAQTLNTLKDLKNERKSLMNQHVVMIYFLSFTFLGIVVAISRLLIPVFQTASFQTTSAFGISLSVGLSNPCQDVYPCIKSQDTGEVICYCEGNQPACIPCEVYASTCSMLGVDKSSAGCYYVSLFFFMSIVQAFFSGLVAGQISEGSLVYGIKHSLILVTITIGAFYILTYLGLIGA
ncbi:MAG: type II secretion system F family protein [Candidatus Aenigmarchaeota archaeon]|nr:type II secretion system F family protein [Candidatus Aenigmarchaeota archaeon]